MKKFFVALSLILAISSTGCNALSCRHPQDMALESKERNLFMIVAEVLETQPVDSSKYFKEEKWPFYTHKMRLRIINYLNQEPRGKIGQVIDAYFQREPIDWLPKFQPNEKAIFFLEKDSYNNIYNFQACGYSRYSAKLVEEIETIMKGN